MTWSPREPDRVTTCTPLDTRGPKRLWNETRPWVQRSSGDVGRLVTHSYLCPVHGRFEVQVPSSDVPDVVPCPLMSWSIAGFAGEHATREIAEAACRASGIGLDEVRLETQRCADDAPWSPSAVATWKSSGEISG